MEQLDFTATNGNGAAAANDNAVIDSGETTPPSIDSKGATGQAQSDRSLVGVIRRHLKNDKIDIRRIHGCYRIVPLNETYFVDDLRAFAERCGIRACDGCHRHLMNVSDYRGVLWACPRCAPTVLDNWYRDHVLSSVGNGGAR
jgi:hypothetical protein